MKKIQSSLLLFALLLCFSAKSQTEHLISIGSVDTLHSEILGEDRALWVYMPNKAYDNPSLTFPVMYLLDGDHYFHTLTAVVSQLSETNNNVVIPDMIVVGIANTTRSHDLTPTKDPTVNMPSGGGEAFTEFLEKELIPYVAKNYPVAPYKMLVGHSLGGLLVTNTLIHHTSLFDAYIALDPSLWWDKMKLIGAAKSKLRKGAFEGKRLFVAIANSFPRGMTASQAQKDTTNATVGYRSVLKFNDLLKTKDKSGLIWDSQYYPEEGHGSVPFLGLHDGLRSIFDFYKRPSFALLTDESPTILENHYLMVSEKMGYHIPPPENTVVGLAWRLRALEENLERAHLFLLLGNKYHPNSIGLHYEWGDWHTAKGDAEAAAASYARAKELEQGKE